MKVGGSFGSDLIVSTGPGSSQYYFCDHISLSTCFSVSQLGMIYQRFLDANKIIDESDLNEEKKHEKDTLLGQGFIQKFRAGSVEKTWKPKLENNWCKPDPLSN